MPVGVSLIATEWGPGDRRRRFRRAATPRSRVHWGAGIQGLMSNAFLRIVAVACAQAIASKAGRVVESIRVADSSISSPATQRGGENLDKEPPTKGARYLIE